MREKWDRQQSGSTYGILTLQRAVANCTNVYSLDSSGGFAVKIKNPGDRLISVGSGDEPPKSRQYSFDDMGNAKRFIDLFGNSIRYSYIDKRWYIYDGRRWKTDTEGITEKLADRAIEAMKAESDYWIKYDEQNGTDMQTSFAKWSRRSRSNASKKAMMSESQHHVPILPKQMDTHEMLLNTPCGIINLRTGQTIEHNPDYYLTKITGAEYSPNVDCPRWLTFLGEIFNNDSDLIRYVQKAVGYSLTGTTKEQCVFFLYGNGRNGKSTFLEVVRSIFGDYCSNIQPETIMVKHSQGSAINSDIARLKGARLVTTVEPNEGARINEGLLKQLTGDDVVTARKLYGDEFEFTPVFKLWMATNHKPIIRGTDTGIWRRIHLIPFTMQIPTSKIDKNLKYKLAAELPGIFRWAVEGCLIWQREGLGMPHAVEAEVREYRREMDVISAFIEDRCSIGVNKSVQSSVLYDAYCDWADKGNEYRMSNTKFSIEVGNTYKKVKVHGVMFFNGIGLD
jgi:putative DNA primase/helicase